MTSLPAELETIKNGLLDIMRDLINVDRDKATLDARLIEDLEIDSLDMVELIMVLERRFHVIFDEDDTDQLSTILDVVMYIDGKIKERDIRS